LVTIAFDLLPAMLREELEKKKKRNEHRSELIDITRIIKE
jgi:hypothetical protein